jgi:hypothetical protein
MIEQLDPRLIPQVSLPIITFSDHTSGLIEFFIKFRTKGSYNHVMWLTHPGIFVSQGNTYSEALASRYMKPGNRLKFVYIVGLTDVQRNIILESINRKLALPWWKKIYDWIGIFGQAIGAPWFNTPGLNYCSEDVPLHIRSLLQYLQTDDPRYSAILNLPRHPSPQILNEYMKQHPETFKVLGKWEGDNG